MSFRFIKVQAFVVASTLSIAILLFAARQHESASGPEFRRVVDLTAAPSAPTMSGQTTLVAPAKLGGAWTLDSLPAGRLVGPLAIIRAQHKNFANSESLITMDDVATYESLHGAIPQGAIVLLSSASVSPTFNSDALHFLVEARNIIGIGGAGTQFVSSDENPYMAKKGIYELQNVANLSLVPESGVVAIAAPQKINGAGEGPVRLMGLVR